MMRSRARVLAFTAGVAVAALAACDSPPPGTDYVAHTDSFIYRISMDPVPPHAREKTKYKIVVRDAKSNQPINGGEGRIFATFMSDSVTNTWDSFAPGTEPGTYYATLDYKLAGPWAVAVQFRADSVKPLDRTDWQQDVRAERDSIP
jgi:hypothetical protein